MLISKMNLRRLYAIKTILLVAILLVLFLSPMRNLIPYTKASPNGFLGGWNYRQSHNIDYSGSESNYQMYFNVYKGSGMSSGNKVYLNSHCVSFPNDINFTDSDNNYYECWMEDSNSTWAGIWVNMTSVPTTMYIYYGNSEQTSFESNGEDTFIFFDDFSGASIDWTNKWTSNEQSKYSIVDGNLKCTRPSANTGFIGSQNSFGESNCLSFKAKMSSSSSYSLYGFYGDDSSNFYYTNAGTGYLPSDTLGGRFRYLRDDSEPIDTAFTISPTEWQSVNLKVANETIDSTCLQDSTQKGSQSANDAAYGHQRYIKFLSYAIGQYSLVDFVHLRKHVEGISHGSWGSEQFAAPEENSVYLSSPPDGATKTTWSVDFKYIPFFYETIQSASLWTNSTGSWARTQWNTTKVQNNTENTISFTFTSEENILWTVEVFNSTNSVFASANRTITIDTPPSYRNVNSNTTAPAANASVLIYGQAYDGIGLKSAWLSTNETGSWHNYTVPAYVAEINEAIDWIVRAQDVHDTGGVANRYDVSSSSWYPSDYDEVTGYIIPTMYNWAEYTGNSSLRDRAKSMADWVYSELEAHSPPNGPWRNVYVPSQMMLGLTRAYEETGNATYKEGAEEVADWLVAVQSNDGSWTGSVSYNGIPHTYHSRQDWGLLWLWKITGNLTYKDTAIKNLDWILDQQLDNGWFHNCSLSASQEPHPGTHGIGYTLTGLIESGKILGNETYINAANKTANALFGLQDSDGSLTGARYYSDWTVYDSSEMLTGSAQICNSWLRLYKLTGNTTWLTAAENMNAYLVTNQGDSPDPGIDGGLPGSDPINGPYMPNKILSWATKFLADSLYHQTKWRPHGSPIDMGDVADTWAWSNFTWSNSRITNGTTVQWRIYYSDTYGNVVGTSIHWFTVGGKPTSIYINPSVIEKTTDDVGNTFKVDVTIQNVTDLWGFDFNLTWNNALIALVNVDFNTTLDNMWGPSGWFVNDSMNVTGPGYYKLAAVSISTGFATTGASPLATLTFYVEEPICNSMKETLMHFETHKLSNSTGQSIPHIVEDGTYRITGQTPTLQMSPDSVTCRKFCENFTIAINVSKVVNVEDFKFGIHYNTTLLDYLNVTWNAWGSGTIYDNSTHGILIGNTSGSPATGNLTLATITFHAAYHHIWKDLPNWKNNLAGTIYFQWANLSYPDATDLRYEKGILYEINMDPIEVVYTFAPIQGDIDNDGHVHVFDLRTVAFYYDDEYDEYNLTGDSVIDLFDLVVITANFNYKYDC